MRMRSAYADLKMEINNIFFLVGIHLSSRDNAVYASVGRHPWYGMAIVLATSLYALQNMCNIHSYANGIQRSRRLTRTSDSKLAFPTATWMAAAFR